MGKPVFLPAEILLPGEGSDMGRWAVLACDQFTSQPEYWQDVEAQVGGAPSTLRMILPEVYLEQPGKEGRTRAIHAAMEEYLRSPLTRAVQGFVYVERTLPGGAVRQGLVGCVDLEDYSYEAGAACRIRPSENTVVARIPPRLAVRRDAVLESPHILMLADDPDKSIIEPVAAWKSRLAPLYDTELMLGGGRVQGWAVTQAADLAAIAAALEKLDDAGRFAALYGEGGAPFALAVGDGNHSLATAKALWEEQKVALAPGERENHPARYCLVELENIQSPAIEVEPIHRVVFDADPAGLLRAQALVAETHGGRLVAPGAGGQEFVAVAPSSAGGLAEVRICYAGLPWPLAVASLEAFLAEYGEDHSEMRVDYVHGEEAVRTLAARGAVGVLLPPFAKSDLFRGVALGGVLPKKTFSMGHATDKRYYLECRKIVG